MVENQHLVIVLYMGNMVIWRSKKQYVIASSSAKAEYRAMTHGVCEVIWIRLMEELKIKNVRNLYIFAVITNKPSV